MLRLKKGFLFLLFTLFGSLCFAQVEFSVNVPEVVAVGEIFHLEFTANEKPDSFTPPSLEGFNVLAGPSSSSKKSVYIVNGEMTQTTTHSYIYAIRIDNKGKYTIPPASIMVNGKTYSSRSVTIEAVDEQNEPANTTPQGNDNPPQAQNTLAPDDILVRIVVNKTSVYKGEPVRASIKLYTRRPMSGVENAKYPSFNGFWTQELNVDDYQWQRENYNNKIYDTRIIREYLLFPQQAGTLVIDPLELTVIAQIITQSRRQSIFDDFFSGGPDIQEVRKKIASSPIRITVKDLPAGAPGSFSGAVGDFTMESEPPASDIAANSAATYTIRISGSGNLPLIQAPKLSLPTSFEQYNIKTTESLNSDTQGISGYRQFEYPVIARAEGEFDIAPVEFSYFSPSQMKYMTLSSPALKINVQPDTTSTGNTRGLVSGLSKEDIKILGQDIRFIKLGNANLRAKDQIFMSSGLYYLIILIMLIAAGFLYTHLKKYFKELRNTVLIRGRRANKVALQRFRVAEKHMNDNNQRGFYEEMLKALWGYMGDKLNIPVANLTKDNIREELLKKGVSSEQAECYITIITECEYAQYAPAVTSKMHDLYAGGVEIVSKLESIIGR